MSRIRISYHAEDDLLCFEKVTSKNASFIDAL
jgi:hypothetical protein